MTDEQIIERIRKRRAALTAMREELQRQDWAAATVIAELDELLKDEEAQGEHPAEVAAAGGE